MKNTNLYLALALLMTGILVGCNNTQDNLQEDNTSEVRILETNGVTLQEEKDQIKVSSSPLLSKRLNYNSDGILTSWEEYEYNDLGKEIKLIDYNSDGSILYEKVSEYNDDGNIVKEIYNYITYLHFKTYNVQFNKGIKL